MNFTKVFLPLD